MATITSARISNPVDDETVLTSSLWDTEFDALYVNDVNINTEVNFQHTATGQHEFADTETINDTAGAELITFSVAATAVNQLQVGNAATGNAPSLAAIGDDAAINVELTPKSTGRVTAGGVNIPTISSTDTFTNKSIDATTNTISGLVPADVGLGNVDNTSDATKNAAAVTLTNKTINFSNNTISNIGSTAITAEMITGQTLVSPASTDSALIVDATDGALKKVAVADFLVGSGDMLAATYDPAGIGEQLVGLIATQTLTNKTLTSPVLNGTLSGTAFLDEDTMSSNSATAAASQQSIKAYVDTSITNAESQAVTAATRAATTTLTGTIYQTLSDTETTITAFNGTAGVTYHCKALGAGDITFNATSLFILGTALDLTTATNDTFDIYMITSTTCELLNYHTGSIVAVNDKAIFGYGISGGKVAMTNLVSNTGVVATDTAGVGTARDSLAAAGYGNTKAIFGYGSTGSDVSMTNLVSNAGVVATDITGVGTARRYLAAAGYGTDKAIFGYGITGGSVSMTNLVSNTGIVATDTTGVGTARYSLAAASYGTDKAIFGYGTTGSAASMTNLVSNTGVVATDTTGVGTARSTLAAAGYGTDKAIFGYGLTGVDVSITNLVSNAGVVATDTTGVGTARRYLAATGYGTDKAIFGYGYASGGVSMTNLVSNTGVVATDTTGVGTARYSPAAATY